MKIIRKSMFLSFDFPFSALDFRLRQQGGGK